MSGRLGRVVQILLHVQDSPHRTALAFASGVMIAFSPFLGIHMGIALVVAFLFRLNRVAILVGTYVNNPWTLAPLYLAGTTLGCLLLRVPADGLAAIEWDGPWREMMHNLAVTLRPYLWPFLLGNTLLGIASGLAAYFVLRRVLEARARRPAAQVG